MTIEDIGRLVECLKLMEEDEDCSLTQQELRFLASASRIIMQLMPSGPHGPFICGIGGETDENGLPERLHICPALGLDGFAVYKKERDYDAPGW